MSAKIRASASVACCIQAALQMGASGAGSVTPQTWTDSPGLSFGGAAGSQRSGGRRAVRNRRLQTAQVYLSLMSRERIAALKVESEVAAGGCCIEVHGVIPRLPIDRRCFGFE